MAKPTIEEYLKQHKAEIINENLKTRNRIQEAKAKTTQGQYVGGHEKTR